MIKSLLQLGRGHHQKKDHAMSKLVNQTALTYMALAIPFYFIFDYFNLHLAANVVFFIECLYLLILFANVKGYLTIAKSGMIIAQAVFILPFYSLYLGPLSGAHLVYVPLAILPIILFEDATFKAKLSMVASVIFCGMCVFLLPNMVALPFNVAIHEGVGTIIYASALLLTFLLVIPQMVFFYSYLTKQYNNYESTLKRVTQFGVSNYPEKDRVMAVLINQIAFIYIVSAIPFYFIFRYFELTLAANFVVVVELLYCLILLSNYKGYLTVAKLGTIFYQACIILPFYNLYLGASAGAHLVYIPLSILPLILFRDASLKFKSSIVTGIIGSAFFFLFLPEVMTLSFQVNLNQKTVEVIYSFALLLTFALVLPQVAFFYLTEKKDKQKILEINRNLTVALNDLKESKALQRQLVQYADYAKLVQRIAHEFKNPLQMLQGTAEVGLQHHKNNSQFKVIKDTVGRLNHVIQPLLSYINPEDGYDLKSLNVKEIVSDMLVLCEANCKARNIQISMDGDELTAPFINADKNAMGQVFMNLITNAMEAIPAEGGSIKIKLSSDLFMNNKDIDAVRIDIVDTGCGIEENQINKIFVPYESSKRSNQNTGLGLSIVMRIINDHDGLIKVDSVVGEGTTVSLWFKEQQEHIEVVKAEQLFELSEDDFEPDLRPVQNPTT